MKNKGLIITTIIFFLTVNTTYYWEGKLGFFKFPAFLILFAIYLALGVALEMQLHLAIQEKLVNKRRHILIGFLTFVLILTFFKPFGIINFDKLEGKNVLVAQREGAANCMTTFKLKNDFTFKELNVCFGVSKVNGTYNYIKRYDIFRKCKTR